MMEWELAVLGFAVGMLLYAVLPEMDLVRRRYYSMNISPFFEEAIKLSPLVFGKNPVLFAVGFAVFEVLTKLKEDPKVLLFLFLFHVSSTAVAYYYFPVGMGVAIVSHYFINRRARGSDMWYVLAVLCLLWMNVYVRIYFFHGH